MCLGPLLPDVNVLFICYDAVDTGTGLRTGRPSNRDYILSKDKNVSLLRILQTGSGATRLPILCAGGSFLAPLNI
jgi:hypothetical protein